MWENILLEAYWKKLKTLTMSFETGASLGLNKFTDAVLTMSDMVCTSTASRLKIMRCAVFSANYILVLVLCPVGL